jgi:hypothetical protein
MAAALAASLSLPEPADPAAAVMPSATQQQLLQQAPGGANRLGPVDAGGGPAFSSSGHPLGANSERCSR